MNIKKILKRKFPILKTLRDLKESIYYQYFQSQNLKNFGYRDPSTVLMPPSQISNPKNVFMYYHTRIQRNCKIITHTGKFIMKKYSGAAPGLTVITGNHTPIVGIPYYSLPLVRTKDTEKDVIVEEDVWIGANVTLLSGVTVGRGAIVGASSVVTKDIPPYAVVVGNPAKIIGVKFTLEQILRHEKMIYSPEERLKENFIKELITTYFVDMKVIGEEIC